jgi:hypothetical protein
LFLYAGPAPEEPTFLVAQVHIIFPSLLLYSGYTITLLLLLIFLYFPYLTVAYGEDDCI